MTLRTPSLLLLRRVISVPSLPVNHLPPRPFQRPLALTLLLPLTLISTLLLITLFNAPLASAQDAPPADKTTDIKVSPAGTTPPHQRSRSSRQPPKKAEPLAAAVPSPVAASAVQPAASSPQPAEDRLPFMANSDRDSHEPPPSAMGLLLRTLGALFLIVGLIVAAAWGMKRFGGARFGTPQENAPPLAVLNSLSLGDRRSLTIVRFGDRTLLLGSTAQTVTLLAEDVTEDLTPPARSVADILNEESPMAFSQALLNATEKLDPQSEPRRGVHVTA